MLLKAPVQWVASPLGFNVLLSKLNKNTPAIEKYTQVAKLLEKNEECKIRNNIFISSSLKLKDEIKNLANHTNILEADFSQDENTFTNYANQFGQLKCLEFSPKTEVILANFTLFESKWYTKGDTGPVMKLYNSFNYSQDIQYEGRLLEVPMQSEFKLVLVMPNEADVLHQLFDTLSERGLTAAVNSIQPLFTAQAGMTPPNIEISSTVLVKENKRIISSSPAVQYGSISVSDAGTRATVLTCIYSPASSMVKAGELITNTARKTSLMPIYFAIVFNDTPIFIGDLCTEMLPISL